MKKLSLVIIVLTAFALAGCQSRSISNSGYRDDYNYLGELSELEVLGVDPNKSSEITENDIIEAFNRSGTIQLQRGDKVVLVQSGAQFPDDAIVREAEQYYKVIPLSGVPNTNKVRPSWDREKAPVETEPLDMAFRLASAKAGAKVLIVYWGVLESAREGYATKTVSWVPIVGSFIPDEDQEMRIRLKAAVIDVESGYWEMLTPTVYEDKRITAGINRENSDQSQVNLLKEQAYERLIVDVQTRYE